MTAPCANDAAVLDDGVLVVRRLRRPMNPGVARHPLATRDGIALFDQMLAASQAWDSMTRVQQGLVVAACRGLAAGATEGDEVTPPYLPLSTRTHTGRSLERKQLVQHVSGGWRLTPLAVLAAHHGQRARRRGVRDVETVQTSGGLL